MDQRYEIFFLFLVRFENGTYNMYARMDPRVMKLVGFKNAAHSMYEGVIADEGMVDMGVYVVVVQVSNLAYDENRGIGL